MKKSLKVLLASTMLFLFSMGLFAQDGPVFDGSGKPPLIWACTTTTVWVWVYAAPTLYIPVPVTTETCGWEYDTSQ